MLKTTARKWHSKPRPSLCLWLSQHLSLYLPPSQLTSQLPSQLLRLSPLSVLLLPLRPLLLRPLILHLHPFLSRLLRLCLSLSLLRLSLLRPHLQRVMQAHHLQL